MRLHDKVVVITGASGLLGKEHAKAVLSEGGSVALLDIQYSELTKFADSLDVEKKSKTRIFECDITDELQVIEVSKVIEEQLGGVTGLVNNAAINASVEGGMRGFTRFEDFSIDVWNREIAVGLTGAMICSRVFGNAMIKNSLAGSMVHIASDHGIIAPNQNLYRIKGLAEDLQPVKPISYSVVKHGLIGLSRYISTYWSNQNIRSNALCPGGVRNGQDQEFLNEFSKLVPLGRPADPDEYHGALIFLLSNESSYMTGATLVVDGGRSVW